MDINLFKSALAGLENGNELVEFFENSVAAEKNRDINEYRAVNARSKKMKEVLTRLGYDGTSDIDEFGNNLMDTIEGSNTKSSGELSELQSTVKRLQRSFELSQTELKAEKEQRETLQKSNRIKTIESKLIPRLSDEMTDAQIVLKAYMADGKLDLDENGEVVVKNGNEIYDYERGIKHILDSHPGMRKNKQTPGGGSSNGGTSGAGFKKPKYTPEQVKVMTSEEAAADIINYNESMQAAAILK